MSGTWLASTSAMPGRIPVGQWIMSMLPAMVDVSIASAAGRPPEDA